MNRLILIIVIAMSFFQVKSQVVKHIGAAEFKQLVDSKEGIILDVRTPEEVAKAHIEGTSAINIADRDFMSKINLMQKDKPIYVYCLTGSRSRTAARIMEQNGFTNVYNLARGVVEWYRAGYPLVAGQNAPTKTSDSYTHESFKNIINSKDAVLVDFNATWCAPCKTMLPIVEKIAEENKAGLEVLKVDISDHQDLAQTYNVRSVPSFILFKNGEKVWQNSGVMSYDDLNSVLKNNLN